MLKEAIEAVSLDKLDEVMKPVRDAYAKGQMDMADYEGLEDLALSRRSIPEANPSGPSAAPGCPRASARRSSDTSRFRTPKRSPSPVDRSRAILWHREVRRSNSLPLHIAKRFTNAGLAVLTVIGREVAEKGVCALYVARIAGLAQVGETTVRKTFRQAVSLGLIRIRERPVRGMPNLSNVIQIISKPWRAWIARSPARKAQAKHVITSAETPVSPMARRRVHLGAGPIRTDIYTKASAAGERAIG